MPVKFALREPRLRAWLLCQQCSNLVSRCEEKVFTQNGITPEQHAVLMAIKYINKPVKVTDVAKWLDRSPHNISHMVDRMESHGLVKRARNLPDRRAVSLVVTQKGKRILEQSIVPGWLLIQEMLSSFSREELKVFTGFLEKLREQAFHYIHPGEVPEEVRTDEEEAMARFFAKMETSDT